MARSRPCQLKTARLVLLAGTGHNCLDILVDQGIQVGRDILDIRLDRGNFPWRLHQHSRR